jgi:hypothetical protein
MSDETNTELEPNETLESKIAKPEHLPDKFWNEDTSEIRIDDLIESYKALEKKLSERKPQTVPDDSVDYEINIKDDLFLVDPDLNQRLKKKGFTQEQAQEVYDLAAEQLLPLLANLMADIKADKEAEKLIAHFGGYDGWREMARQLKAYGTKKLPQETLQSLASSFDGILILHKMMMQDIGDGVTVSGKSVSGGQVTDINAMMKNPKYWRDKDPSYIAKVTEAFERAYD